MLFAFLGESGSVLDKTQTFVGVLTTLIVLCLVRDRTNFISGLVQTIHLESDILRRTRDLNKSIREGNTLSELIEKITRRKVKIQDLPVNIQNDILKEWRQVEIQPNIFNNYAVERNTDYQNKYAEMKSRKEGFYNARFSFVILLIVMLVDCWPVNERFACLFLLFMLILYVDFTMVLWVKYIVGKSNRKHVFFTKTKGLTVSFVILLFSYLIALYMLVNHEMTQIGAKVAFAFSFIIAFAFMAHYKVLGVENSGKNNNGWLAKHAVYITISSIILTLCTCAITEWLQGMKSNDYSYFCLRHNILCLSDDISMMRTIFVSYVAINTFFVEVLACYAYNTWFKFDNLSLIKARYEECKREKRIHLDLCKKIISTKIMNSELKGAMIPPQKEFNKRITIGNHELIIELKWFKWR